MAKSTRRNFLFALAGFLSALIVADVLSVGKRELAPDTTIAEGSQTAQSSSPAQTPQGVSPREIAQHSFPSVVFIAMQFPGSRRVSAGSGFIVKPGFVATNFHVIEGTVSGVVNLVGNTEKIPVQGVAAVDPERDLALLAVPDLAASPLDLGSSDGVSVGDKVFVVGNPNGLEGTFSDGIVSGKRSWRESYLLQITAPISTGSSGGPVLDAQGKVVGMAKGSWQNGQNLNFALSSDLLKPLLERAGEVQQLAKVTHPQTVKPAGQVESSNWIGRFVRRLRQIVG